MSLSGRPDALAERYAPGEAAGPLLRAILGGLVGSLVLLALDRIWPEPWLVLGAGASGDARALPLGLLVPALLADLLLGQPDRTAMGVLGLVLGLTTANFVYVYGQFRRFVPGGDLWRGVAWAGLLALLAGGTLLPRAIPWLEEAAAGGAARLLIAAALLSLEFGLAIVAHGLTAALISPTNSGPSSGGDGAGGGLIRP